MTAQQLVVELGDQSVGAVPVGRALQGEDLAVADRVGRGSAARGSGPRTVGDSLPRREPRDLEFARPGLRLVGAGTMPTRASRTISSQRRGRACRSLMLMLIVLASWTLRPW